MMRLNSYIGLREVELNIMMIEVSGATNCIMMEVGGATNRMMMKASGATICL